MLIRLSAIALSTILIISIYVLYKNIVYVPKWHEHFLNLPYQKKEDVFKALRDFDKIKNWREGLYKRIPTSPFWQKDASYQESFSVEGKEIDYHVQVLVYTEFTHLSLVWHKAGVFNRHLHYTLGDYEGGVKLKVRHQIQFHQILAKTSATFLETELKKNWEKDLENLKNYLSKSQ